MSDITCVPPEAADEFGQEAADAFTAWLQRHGFIGRITEGQCKAMAMPFMAGYVLGAVAEQERH